MIRKSLLLLGLGATTLLLMIYFHYNMLRTFTLHRPERNAGQGNLTPPSTQLSTMGRNLTSTTVLPATVNTVLPMSASEEATFEQIRRYTNTLPNTTEVSVVTAYFNLGSLNKRGTHGHYTPTMYNGWMSSFAWLDNPVVVFTDNNQTATLFRGLRAHYSPNRTKVIILQRKELWAFQLEDEIKKVFSQPKYPRHPPNTVNPLYSCAMHAKYDLVQKVIREQWYQTRYIAWVDVGYFRFEVNKNKTIHLTVPTDFKRTHVGCSQVNGFMTMTPQELIKKNKVWVAGGLFLATPKMAYIYCSDYKRAVRKLLDMKWMSTDQQVIYSMHQPSFNFKRRFELQPYTGSKISPNAWFTIGYLMKEAP